MLVSLNWLRDYLDAELPPAVEMAERLTMAGLEVDSLKEVAPAFSGVRVAVIRSLKPHPTANHLLLCDVSTGDADYPIVCGAHNIKIGDAVPLALVGASLPGGIVIRSSKIRGELSEGMLCSESELGIGDDTTGIMILPVGTTSGRELTEVFNLRDTVFDISVTPNRSDCLSIVGIAREWAAIAGKGLRYPPAEVRENEEDIRKITAVSILDPDLCPRYTARIITNIRIGPSPLWIRQRLEAIGLRPINNIVDVTNFVMMELGQPLHAFDFRFLEKGKIVVRRSLEGERFTSLDGKERTLHAGTLMICDGVKPVAIGGVMGGLNSEVKEDTEMILLESAYFNPVSIRKTSRELGMGTDAAYRFERGIDPEGVIRALNRAARLMAELSGGTVCKGVIDQYPQKIPTAQRIPLRVSRIRSILGTAVPEGEMVQILRRLEMAVDSAGAGEYKVTPPTCRVDITREIDCIEEIARLYGYDKVPVTLPGVSAMAGHREKNLMVEDRLREIMTGSGYTEVINYSFIPASAVEHLGLGEADERRNQVTIRNPLTEEQAVMRTSMTYSLLMNARRNADIGRSDLRIFELGRTFASRGAGIQPLEQNRLGCLITGLRYEDLWHSQGAHADFYDLKGCIENMLAVLRIPSPVFRAGVHDPVLHPGKSCGIFCGDNMIGCMGEVHPEVMIRMELSGRVMLCEMNLDLMSAFFSTNVSFHSIPRFPSSSRDVAFLIPGELEAGTMLCLATDSHEELLEKVRIFDVYEGKHIPPGMKSLGLRFSYRSPDGTLTDDEVNEVHGRITRMIIETTGAVIR